VNEPRPRSPALGLVDLVVEQARTITRAYVALVMSQVALAIYAWSNGDRTMAGIAALVALLCVVRLVRHLS
jgi:hypothetical protein